MKNTKDAKADRKLVVLSVNALHHTAEFDRSHYEVKVDEKTSLEDVLRAGFWAHHANKLKRGDLIDIVSGDYMLDAQVRVITVDAPGSLVWVRLRFVAEARDIDQSALGDGEDAEPLPELPAGYKVGFTKQRQWFVSNGNMTPPVIVSEDNETERDAYDAAIEHAENAESQAA